MKMNEQFELNANWSIRNRHLIWSHSSEIEIVNRGGAEVDNAFRGVTIYYVTP